jgi:hypothetical protein
MGYRINAKRKTVDVVGDADLDAIVRKVIKLGGNGWRLTTVIPQHVLDNMVDQVTERTIVRPIGFRQVSPEGGCWPCCGLAFLTTKGRGMIATLTFDLADEQDQKLHRRAVGADDAFNALREMGEYLRDRTKHHDLSKDERERFLCILVDHGVTLQD